MNATTSPAPIKIDWVELDLGAIIDRYGWESTIQGLKNLLPPGETISSMIAAIEEQNEADLCEEHQYIAISDRASYLSDCF